MPYVSSQNQLGNIVETVMLMPLLHEFTSQLGMDNFQPPALSLFFDLLPGIIYFVFSDVASHHLCSLVLFVQKGNCLYEISHMVSHKAM